MGSPFENLMEHFRGIEHDLGLSPVGVVRDQFFDGKPFGTPSGRSSAAIQPLQPMPQRT